MVDFVLDAGVGSPTEGPYHVVPGVLTFPAYTTGGYTFLTAETKTRTIRKARAQGPSSLGYNCRWNASTSKLQAYKAGGETTESLPDVTGGVFANRATTGTTALNGAAIIAAITATTAAKTTIAAQPNALDAEVAGRNVIVQIGTSAGGTLPAAVGTCTVVGTTPSGVAQTEVIDLAALNSVAITANQFVYVVGTKAFGTVTSATLSINLTATIATATVSLGVGTIFGLKGAIASEADIKSVRKDAAAVAAATYVATANPSQIDLGADCADAVDLIIEYQSGLSEALAGGTVGDVIVDVLGD